MLLVCQCQRVYTKAVLHVFLSKDFVLRTKPKTLGVAELCDNRLELSGLCSIVHAKRTNTLVINEPVNTIKKRF